MTDFQELVRQIAHLAGEQVTMKLTASQIAGSNARLAEMATPGELTRTYADPTILDAEGAAVKARSRAKYGMKKNV